MLSISVQFSFSSLNVFSSMLSKISKKQRLSTPFFSFCILLFYVMPLSFVVPNLLTQNLIGLYVQRFIVFVCIILKELSSFSVIIYFNINSLLFFIDNHKKYITIVIDRLCKLVYRDRKKCTEDNLAPYSLPNKKTIYICAGAIPI